MDDANHARIVAVDGGGSASRAALAEGMLTIARTAGGPLQLATMTHGAATDTLDALADGILDAAGPDERVSAVCVGAAGAVGEERTTPVHAWAARRFPRARVRVTRDIDLVLALATPPAIALIAGTGVAALARDASGAEHAADGYGYLLGDRGGGFWVATEALRRALRAADTGGEEPRLLAELIAALGLRHRSELPRLAAGGHVPVQRLAALAPVVGRAADAGDPLARSVLAEAVDELAATLHGLRLRSGLGQAPVVVCGGLTNATQVGPALVARLEQRAGRGSVRVVEDGLEGALQLARDLLDKRS